MGTQETRMNGNWRRRDSQAGNGERLANALGWFSIGLGLAEVATPGKVAELIGVRNQDRTRAVLRAYGLREIAAGIGILTRPQPAGWVWGRVAGDLLDLSSLGSALNTMSYGCSLGSVTGKCNFCTGRSTRLKMAPHFCYTRW